MRVPVVGALRVAGTKMVAAKFFGSHLLGAALIALCAFAELDSTYFDPPDPNAAPRPTVPLEATPLPRVQLHREKHVPIPSSWSSKRAGLGNTIMYNWEFGQRDLRCRRVDAGEKVRLAIEQGMHATAHAACVGRDGTGKTRRAKVISVERVENIPLWKQVCSSAPTACPTECPSLPRTAAHADAACVRSLVVRVRRHLSSATCSGRLRSIGTRSMNSSTRTTPTMSTCSRSARPP